MIWVWVELTHWNIQTLEMIRIPDPGDDSRHGRQRIRRRSRGPRRTGRDWRERLIPPSRWAWKCRSQRVDSVLKIKLPWDRCDGGLVVFNGLFPASFIGYHDFFIQFTINKWQDTLESKVTALYTTPKWLTKSSLTPGSPSKSSSNRS